MFVYFNEIVLNLIIQWTTKTREIFVDKIIIFTKLNAKIPVVVVDSLTFNRMYISLNNIYHTTVYYSKPDWKIVVV